MSLPRKLLQITAVFFILLISSACSDRETSRPLQVGTNLWPGYEPVHIANHLNYFDSQDIRHVVLPSATEVIRAFRNKVIDVAALTYDEVLLLAESGVEVEIILIADFSHGGDVIVSQPEIVDMSGLKGKRVGVEDSALGAYVLGRALELNDMVPSDIYPRPFAIDQHEIAFLEKQVDAVVTFDPVKTKLLKAGANQLFDSTEIPGEIIDVLIVRKGLSDEKDKQVQMLVNSWYKAVELIKQKPDLAAVISAKHLGISESEFLLSLQGMEISDRSASKAAMLDGTLLETGNKLKRIMLDNQLLNDGNINVSDLINSGYL
ncbi:ABC transporter substrate-binding protein [Neptuniibacter sp.]|uniref:ABC transporter substrate-binding protein n=1 Tax=Neptuniibacter sp. TaxID=1962643 RepID=UPI0026121512|nr:ABC transporter substrate-binding protein [Neptuniibacter sp.]MCP4596598.1 ABC transporter substrate-binding protein [Neptuniibacter sp.]